MDTLYSCQAVVTGWRAWAAPADLVELGSGSQDNYTRPCHSEGTPFPRDTSLVDLRWDYTRCPVVAVVVLAAAEVVEQVVTAVDLMVSSCRCH